MKFTSDVVVGLEVHVELDTKSKLFCGCSTKGNENPNTRTCPICLGHPGTRPVLNKKVLEYAMKICLAVNSQLSKELVFSRKSYFYPDMSKNFQITQFEEPLGSRGKIPLKSGKNINITRLHIEEDPASLVYPGSMESSPYVFIDYNRAGNPLIEVVTDPELTSPAEARDFLNQLITILAYLKIFDINTCIIKADANISIKESNYTRVEVKNITGFKELERALNYEITRQKALLKRGLKIKRETRGWNDAAKTTKSLRTKETEEDYGYIIEPDLSIIEITDKLASSIKKQIPELAYQKTKRFIEQYKIDPIDAEVMASERELADLFENISQKVNPSFTARWLRRELLRVLNYNKKTLRDIKFGQKELIELFELIHSQKISETTGQKLMEKLVEDVFSPKEYVSKHGLHQVTSENEIREVAVKVIKENMKAVEDYLKGEEKSFHYLLGQVMKHTKGKAEPKLTNQILKEEIEKLGND